VGPLSQFCDTDASERSLYRLRGEAGRSLAFRLSVNRP
jgi:hypothetical protein